MKGVKSFPSGFSSGQYPHFAESRLQKTHIKITSCFQIAGAFYGFKGIPESFRKGLAKPELIADFAEKLHNMV